MTTLEAQIQQLKAENLRLKEELAQLKKLIFSSRRERFVSQAPDSLQGNLFADTAQEAEPEPPAVEQVLVKKVKKKNKPLAPPAGRNSFPASLRREEQVIEPEGVNTAEMIKIGEDITELLAYTPAQLYVKRIVRPRYASRQPQDTAAVVQAAIPPRLIAKGMVDESLISWLIIEKMLYHTPIHRFRKKLKQAGLHFVSENSLLNWFHQAAQALLPLYHLLVKDVLAQPYNQADESPQAVLCKNKPGATHRGYMWLAYNPALKAVVFHYDPSRSTEAACKLLGDYSGILQTDGYEVYDKLARPRDIQLIHCMAHARRKFIDAQNSDPPRANYFLSQVQKLYVLEQQARDQQMDHSQRLELRQKQALPLLEELGRWLEKQYNTPQVLPKSLIGKAIAYSLKRWKGLCAYAHDGQLEIDNNLIENTIRPLALGRKNYLFAGSHEAAHHLACLYSIIGTCEKHGLNAQAYLTWLLQMAATQKITDKAVNWLPHRLNEELLAKFRL